MSLTLTFAKTSILNVMCQTGWPFSVADSISSSRIPCVRSWPRACSAKSVAFRVASWTVDIAAINPNNNTKNGAVQPERAACWLDSRRRVTLYAYPIGVRRRSQADGLHGSRIRTGTLRSKAGRLSDDNIYVSIIARTMFASILTALEKAPSRSGCAASTCTPRRRSQRHWKESPMAISRPSNRG